MGFLRGSEERLFASALPVEHFAAQRLGESLLVGVACKRQLPKKPVISFGFAGALCDTLPIAAVVVVAKVVDEDGKALWGGTPLTVQGARAVVVVTAGRIIDNPEERAELRKRSGADVVDMETGIYARQKLLIGGLRVISDTPAHQLASMNGLWCASKALRALYSLKF